MVQVREVVDLSRGPREPCAPAVFVFLHYNVSVYLKSIELAGFKSFGKKTELVFGSSISSVVGPNGSGKSNVAEAFRFAGGR